MAKEKQFVVLGLGRFGQAVTKTLIDNGCHVMAVDISIDRVNEVAEYSTYVAQGDVTDEKLMRSLGLSNFDCVIIAIAGQLEASIFATILAKELGAKYVLAKTTTAIHKKVLYKAGADKVVFPEKAMGERVANLLLNSHLVDYFHVLEEHSIAEIIPIDKWHNKSLKDSNIRATTGLTIISIKREGKIVVSPRPDEIIMKGDVLIVIGMNKDLVNFEGETREGGFNGIFD